MGQDQLKGTVSTPSNMPGLVRAGYSLKPNMPAKRLRSFMADFDGLAADNDPVGVDCRGNTALSERHGLAASANQLVQYLARLGEK